MLHHVVLIRTDISEEYITSTIRVTRIGELGTLAVTSNRSMLQRNIMFLRNVSSYKSHMATTQRIGFFISHCHETLKSYIALTGWAL
jgi:hypothetical protein